MREQKIYKAILKVLKYGFLGVSALFLLVFILFFTITQLYSDQLKQMAFEQINANLKTELTAKSVDVSIIDQFPNISITFSNVVIIDPYNDQDTLLNSEKLYLKFNALDFLKRNYTINSISLENGRINAVVNEKGEENYLIVNSTDTTANSQFSFVLDEVTLDNFKVEYSNILSNQFYSFDTENIVFSGDFDQREFKMNLKSRMTVNSFIAQEIEYVKNKSAEIDLELLVNNDSSFININRGKLSVADMNFNIIGTFNSNDEIQLMINGDNIQLSQVFSVFPIDYLSVLKKYRSNGKLEFNASVEGDLSINKPLKMVSSFNVKNGSFVALTNNVTLDRLNLKGDFDNSKGKLTFESFSGYFGNQSINGSLSIEQFDNPLVVFKIKGGLDFEKLSKFSKEDLGLDVFGSGDLFLDTRLKFENNKINIKKAVGQLDSKSIKIIKNNVQIDFSNLLVKTINNNLAFEKIQGKLDENKFKGNVVVYDWIKIVFESNKKIKIESEINFEKLDLGKLTESFSSVSSSSENAWDYNLNSRININELTFEKFNASNVKSKWIVNSKNISCKKLLFEAQGGDYKITGNLNNELNKIKANGFVNNVKVNRFFDAFENFNQNFLTKEQINGNLNLNFNFDASMLSDYEIDYDNMKVNSDVKFKGTLINHPFLRELLDYFNSNALTKNIVDYDFFNKKIKKVVFEEFSSKITIDKGKVYVPKTQLNNNVLNMNVSGWQSFNDSIDYHLSFNWRELRRSKIKEGDFGEIKDDGLGNQLYMNIQGTIDNPIYKLDRSQKKEIRKEKIQKEKDQIKKIISGESLPEDDSGSTPKFEVTWEEDVDTNSIKKEIKEEKPKKPKDSTKINKWLKKLGVEEKEKEKTLFEIEN